MQLSLSVEMEAYGDKIAAARNQICCKSREEPILKTKIILCRVVQLAKVKQSDKGHFYQLRFKICLGRMQLVPLSLSWIPPTRSWGMLTF